jgi:hypothetical protein
MECKFHQLTGAFHDRALSAGEREAYRLHLSECGECTRELERLQSITRLFAAAAVPARKRMPDLAKVGFVRRSLLHWTEALAAAAMLMLALCGFALFKFSPPAGKAPQSAWERTAAMEQFEPAPEMEAVALALQSGGGE